MFYIAYHKSGNTEISYKPTWFDTSELWDLHHAQVPLHYTYSNQPLVQGTFNHFYSLQNFRIYI